MSGAGKSTVLDALEDMGWDCVDNLPTALLEQFVHGERAARQSLPVAVGMDVRSRGFDPFDLPALLRSIEGVTPEVLYVDCAAADCAASSESASVADTRKVRMKAAIVSARTACRWDRCHHRR